MCQFTPYYNPISGRFITEDSVRGKKRDHLPKKEIDDPLSLNLYTYCYNNPINMIDPSGHTAAQLTMVYEYTKTTDTTEKRIHY